MAKKTETDGKRKKRLWIILLPVFGVLAALFVAAFWIAALLFGGEPQLPVEPLRPEDFKLISKLTARFSNEFLNGKPEESELVLSPGEIASLIRVSDNGALLMMFGGGSGGGKTKNYDARFENGRFEILSPVRTGLTWLRGGVIMVDMSVRPEKDGDELTLDISRIRAGFDHAARLSRRPDAPPVARRGAEPGGVPAVRPLREKPSRRRRKQSADRLSPGGTAEADALQKCSSSSR